MFITRMEYREKATATNWKRIQFPLHANFVSDNAELSVRLLHIIAALPAFGANAQNHGFADAISRIVFQAAHSEYMWFAKSTLQDDNLLVDEEELYDKGDALLMRRAFGELTIGDAPAEELPVAESMLAQHPELDVLQKLQQAFQRVQVYQLTEENKDQALQQILTAPHGTLLLVDGSSLNAPLDLSAVSERNDIQVLTTNCTGLPEMTITQKGKMISCQ